VRLVLSPMPPQTLVERAEELISQARAGRIHLHCRVPADGAGQHTPRDPERRRHAGGKGHG